ncbi:hypothetical protein KL912_002004 [Ogataea haglerorum]|uniref:Uncharacterized protein n=1 Tax=Ogataea haglerorum TaxID=1937702 RepID=A0ABQ7RJ72_9ASCO|nr:hypothetical protein KL912_002004 [Ogataea haglerorum]KAG7766622.1 hypothetical protein KL946_001810 [Ogataea haglerorum]
MAPLRAASKTSIALYLAGHWLSRGPSSATWRRRERGDRIPAQHQCAAGNDERKQTAMPLLLAKGVSGTPV